MLYLSCDCFIFPTDVTISVPDRKVVIEDEGIVQVCATLMSTKIERFFSVSLNTGNGTGKVTQASTSYCIEKFQV